MAIDYARAEKTAQRLIRENGKIAHIMVTWHDAQQYVATGYWQEGYVSATGGTPWNPPDDWRYEYPVWFVETTASEKRRGNTMIQMGDIAGLVSTQALTVPGGVPILSRYIRIDGQEYMIAELKPVRPSSTVVVYKLHAKQ